MAELYAVTSVHVDALKVVPVPSSLYQTPGDWIGAPQFSIPKRSKVAKVVEPASYTDPSDKSISLAFSHLSLDKPVSPNSLNP